MINTKDLLADDPNRDMVISFRTIRRAVGWLGIALPVVCYFGTWIFGACSVLKPSISDYFYTIMGSVLVGVMCAVALFLFTYKGPAKIDGILSGLAATFALGVAFFPCNVSDGQYACNIICRQPSELRNTIHYCSATGFFIVLALMSLWLFRRTNKKDPAKPKRSRNTVYLVCGLIMVAAMAGILSLKVFHLGEKLAWLRPTYWLELIALWAFGISWLVKGEIVLKDHPVIPHHHDKTN
ncbi:hypothetical protein [Mucilaginibacter sp.]|uniref:hypothetical protein n=1 Tax=Mucilaginibacter sp. TaxID=1882438 RepID=UPI003D104A7B